MAVASQGWDGPGTGDANLTYYIANTPAGMSKSEVSAAIKTALEAWSNVASVHFTESKTPGLAKQLDISFANIDGSGGTLAQAYFPADVNPSRIAGDIQFDSSENWEIGNGKGAAAFDLVRVAVHEIGHSLGLEHSGHSSAVLAPSVSPNEYFTTLDHDDVDAILSLYAAAKTVSAPTSLGNPAAVPNQTAVPTSPTITTPPVATTPPLTSTPPTPTQPATPCKPLDSNKDWTILNARNSRFRWSSGFAEVYRMELYRLRRFFG